MINYGWKEKEFFCINYCLNIAQNKRNKKTAKGQKLQFLNQLVQSFSGRAANVSINVPGKVVESI